MKPSDLVFLEDPDAALLVASWPYLDEPRTDERWIELAGVDPSAMRLARVLKVSAICLPDGTADPLALQFIAQRMMKSVRGGRRIRTPRGDNE